MPYNTNILLVSRYTVNQYLPFIETNETMSCYGNVSMEYFLAISNISLKQQVWCGVYWRCTFVILSIVNHDLVNHDFLSHGILLFTWWVTSSRKAKRLLILGHKTVFFFVCVCLSLSSSSSVSFYEPIRTRFILQFVHSELSISCLAKTKQNCRD